VNEGRTAPVFAAEVNFDEPIVELQAAMIVHTGSMYVSGVAHECHGWQRETPEVGGVDSQEREA